MLATRLLRFARRRLERLRPPPRETGPAREPLRRAVLESRALLERILMENIVPFWYPRCLDEELGGYRLHHDWRGTFKGPANKRTVNHARTLWFFARLARSGRRTEEALSAARHGYAFLSSRLWDQRNGGFYWEVDPAGDRPTVDHKLIFAQNDALYALSEYAMVTGDASAARLASATFEEMEKHFRDPVHGGYWERLTADWQPGNFPPALTRSPAGIKTMNAHLHSLEAVTRYFEATGSATARERMMELLRIETQAIFRPASGSCSDAHRADWTPLLDPEHARVSYGHDLENLMLVIATCRAAAIPPGTYLDFFRAVCLSAMRWGYDRRGGGFYKEGPLGKPADDRSKSWWVQAEALPATLEMFRLTEDTVYARCYLGTLDWIITHQVDWDHGDWHPEPVRRGQVPGDKAGDWKDPYHNGRAMLHCLELLDGMAP